MRQEEHLLKTMSALRVCLSECLGAESPLSALSRYLQGLRRNPQWKECEVAEVEAAARRALNAATANRPQVR